MTTLPHAIYGSATGLGDYRILASTAPFDDRLRSTIIYYANLEGSARSTPFDPIFSFYSLGDNRWAFSRTLCLGATPRGNDYLVHAIVLDAAAMAEIDYKPFALERLFVSAKPAEGSVLRPLALGVGRGAFGSSRLSGIASCLRALSRGALRLRVVDGAVDLCREIHESLPPDDRVATTFCTRFSYGRNLAFQLAAFAPEDESRVRETAPNATLADFPPPGISAPDLFDRWTSEFRGQADFDLVGLSVLRDVQEAFSLIDGVRQLRRWTAGDVSGLEKASALVLRKENRGREVVQSVLPGAFAVDLVRRVRAGEVFDESEVEPVVRRAAVQWLRQLKTTPAEAWMAEMQLLLADGTLADVEQGLKRVQLASRPFLSTLFARMRDRFGAEGARVAAAAAPLLSGDALLGYVRAMEETGSRDWLLAIVRGVTGIAPAIPARIILTNGLLSEMTDAELEMFGPAFFVLEEKLANALANTTAAERPALYRVLADVAQTRLREGWVPATDVARRVMLGGVESGVPNAHLTILAFFAPHRAVIEHIARNGVTPEQAALLLRVLGTVLVDRTTLIVLRETARRRPPQNIWNRLRWHLRLRTLSEVVG